MNAAWRLVVLLLSLAVALWAVGLSLGADPGKPNAPNAAPKATPGKADTTSAAPEATNENNRVLREQTIYIPYEKLRKVFEKEGRGVFLPYEKFRELWQAAQTKKVATPEAKPPVAAVITEADHEATVSKDVVQVRAVLKIEVLQEGWNEVALRLADAAIVEATIGGNPARVVSAGPAGYKLLVENDQKKPRQIELVLRYAKAMVRSPGQNSVSFEAPQAAVSRWRVRIPEDGVKVSLHPTIAATELAPASKSGDAKAETKPIAADAPGANETVVVAFVGAAPTVRIEWTPKAEGAAGLEALATVQAEQQVTISEGVTRSRAQLAYTISRAELRQLSIQVPADQKVANVFDPNVRQWSVEPAGPTQRIQVQLFEPARQTQGLAIELEKYTDEKQPGPVQVPVIQALGVGRQQGVVVVQVAEGLRAEAARTGGLLQIDAAELPPSLAPGRWAFAYRYAAVPFDLQLTIEKVQPRIVVESLVEAEVQPERLTLDVLALYDIQRAGVFQLDLELPAGYTVLRVRGRSAVGAAAAPYDTHHIEGQEQPRLVVQLAKKAIGRVGLHVELSRDIRQPDLLVPSGKAVAVEVGIPRGVAGREGRSAGRVIVLAPESLQINPSKAEGLRRISFKEAIEGMESPRQGKPSDARPVLEFAHTQDPATLVLSAERRRPFATVRQFLVGQIEDGAMTYEATFFHTVQYSGVKSLRIDLPAGIADLVNVPTPGVRHEVIAPPPKDTAQGYVAWRVFAGKEMLGDGQFQLRWTDRRMQKLDVGRSVLIEVPHLRPREVDRAWGQIVLKKKSETIDIDETQGKLENLRPIDPQHDLMPGASAPDAARAYEFHDDFVLSVAAVRYQLHDIKHTSIERVLLRMVVTRADLVAVQALYQMRSAQQRLAVVLPEGAQVDQRPRLNGQPVVLERGGPNEYFVPLPSVGPDQVFLLEIQYSVPGGSRLEYPVFHEEPAPAVQKVYLAAYVPQEKVLLGKQGPWTDEFFWRSHGLSWRPTPYRQEHELLQWITEGTGQHASSVPFATDGQMYLFSTLRPAEPETGALRLTTLREEWVHGLVMALVVVGGVVLIPWGARVRVLAIALAALAWMAGAVFAPMLARQVADGVATALGLVLILWLTAFVWSMRRTRRPAATTGGSPEAQQPPPSNDASVSQPPASLEGGPSHA